MVKSNIIGRSFEYRVLYYLKKQGMIATRIPVSGIAKDYKGDIKWTFNQPEIKVCHNPMILTDCKKTTKKSIRFTEEWMKKIDKESGERIGSIIFGFQNSPMYIVLKLDDFLKI